MYELIIIGGGPAGLAAAVAAKEQGIETILILERDNALGGILNQCIHNGFGLHIFKEELTGPEYAQKFINQIKELNIEYKLGTLVLKVVDKEVIAVSEEEGLQIYKAQAIIFAMGCRERPRGAINIPGSRVAGVYSAGTAQKFVNIQGKMPGREVVIVGSGDIGLIMARRMLFEGAVVKCVVELMPYSGGLKRNIVQCLNDYSIPLKLSHTVTRIEGRDRVTGVYIAEVDLQLKPVSETEEYIPCDTVLFSVGLLPENELSKEMGIEIGITGGPIVDETMQTNKEGVFACGNVVHVHDLADFVTEESRVAGIEAAKYIQGQKKLSKYIAIKKGKGIRYTVPEKLHEDISGETTVRYRVDNVYRKGKVVLYKGNEKLSSKSFRIMTPGEMEKIIIKPEYMEGESKETLYICIEGGVE